MNIEGGNQKTLQEMYEDEIEIHEATPTRVTAYVRGRPYVFEKRGNEFECVEFPNPKPVLPKMQWEMLVQKVHQERLMAEQDLKNKRNIRRQLDAFE